jgi:PemK-like, MazF-like toxin of type II toxin-antitoxin system
LTAGDIVIAAFPGAQMTKTRPAVVLSTAAYHEHGADVIVGLITTKSEDQLRPTDCDIRNWKAAGLHAPSRFRLYLATLLQRDVRVVGRLAEDDWQLIQRCVRDGIIGT